MIEAIVFALLVVFHIWRSIFRNTVQWLFVVLPLVALYVIARWAVSVSIRDSPGYRVHFCDLYQQEGARHMTLGSYGKLATEVYDITKPVGQTFEGGDRRLEFYLERLKSCTGRVLEPAVGTGRMMILLMEAGLEVEGVDNSPEMLAVCRARCAERGLDPVLYEGDMGSLSLPERYEAIIIPAGSFLLIERREESLGALKRFREHLVPGGRLILDIELQTDFSVGTISTGTVETPQGETITTGSKVVEVNFLEQYTVSHLRYEKWREGKLLQTEMQRFALRWYGLEEFELVLESLGFTEVVVSADYEYGKRPSRAEQTFTYEARCA